MKSPDKVRIRMYRQGLGDCFLLSFNPEKKNAIHILIDCGVLSTSLESAQKMEEVANDIKASADNKLAVVVATHEHWDHVSGFKQAWNVFKDVDIDEIWMAWTEDPKDDFAKDLNENKKMRLNAVQTAFSKINAMDQAGLSSEQKDGLTQYLKAYDSFFGFYGMDYDGSQGIFNMSKTGEAMELLKNRPNTLKVFHTPATDNIVELKELPGVRFYILGPPKDLKALNKMNPSKRQREVYELVFNYSGGLSFISAFNNEHDTFKPFSNNECFAALSSADFIKRYYDSENSWRKIDNDWLYSAGNLAIALDKSVNNTSLTFAIELIDSGKVLLFAADAQVGNWLSWGNYEWTVKNNGSKEKVTIDDLLARTVLYKVGHHGSHNATLREEGLEKMTNKELIAMVPVDQQTAENRRWKMPFKPLLKALNEKAGNRVVIMDESYPEIIKTANRGTASPNTLYYDVIIHN